VSVRTFLAIYRGPTVAEAELIAVSSDPTIVAEVAMRLLRTGDLPNIDPVLRAKRRGTRAALRFVRREASGAPDAI
jgi:hypothetical protein